MTTEVRPEFQAMLRFIRFNPGSNLVVTRFDRLYRDSSRGQKLFRDLEHQGVKIWRQSRDRSGISA
jgi:DNA invertase Pin-like site-specific DNA recombinase